MNPAPLKPESNAVLSALLINPALLVVALGIIAPTCVPLNSVITPLAEVDPKTRFAVATFCIFA